MPQNVTIRISPTEAANEKLLKQRLASAVKTKPENINAYQIIRRSLDARSRNIIAQLQVNVFINEEFSDAFEFHPNLQNVEMKTAELLSGIDGTMMFRYNSKDTFQALYVYLSEYHSGKRVSHKRVLELSYEDVKSAKNGLIVITPDFDNFTAKLIAADEYSKYMTETPILEGVANREYYGRSATSIENKSTIEYGTEQGLAALIYGEQGVSSLPIQDITGEYIDTDNEYMYYYSAEFVK